MTRLDGIDLLVAALLRAQLDPVQGDRAWLSRCPRSLDRCLAFAPGNSATPVRARCRVGRACSLSDVLAALPLTAPQARAITGAPRPQPVRPLWGGE